MLHTFPFMISDLQLALKLAYIVVVVELLVNAYICYHFMKSPLGKTIVQVVLGRFGVRHRFMAGNTGRGR